MPLFHTGVHDPADLGRWASEPQLAFALTAAAAAYLVLAGPLRRRLGGEAFAPWRAVAMLSGLGLFYVAAASPIDRLGEVYLFWVHMVQHALIVYAIAPLLLAGLPPWLASWALDRRPLAAPLAFLTGPLPAFLLFNAVFQGWHFPWAYEWALRDRLVHDLEHATVLLAAIAMWWPVFTPVRAWGRAKPGALLLYLFVLPVAQIPLFGFLTFGDEVLFPTYAAAPRLAAPFDLTPLEDQVVGGMVMKVSAAVVYVAAFAAVFFRWAFTERPPRTARRAGSGSEGA